MTSVDLKGAYHSVPIAKDADQKYLNFQWQVNLSTSQHISILVNTLNCKGQTSNTILDVKILIISIFLGILKDYSVSCSLQNPPCSPRRSSLWFDHS